MAVGVLGGAAASIVWALVTTRFRRLLLLVLAFVGAAGLSLLLGELIAHIVDGPVRAAFESDASVLRYRDSSGFVHPGDPLLAGGVAMLAVGSSYLPHRLNTRIALLLTLYALASLGAAGVLAVGLPADIGSGLIVGSALLLLAGRHDLAPDGHLVFVKVLGRDERSADLMFRAYRWLRLRGAVDHRPFVSLRRAVEHEALVALQAASLDIPTPRVLGVAEAGLDGMLIAYDQVAGRSADRLDDIDDDALAAIWQMVNGLHQKHIAHRDLRLANIFVGDDGAVRMIGFGFAELAASDQMLGTDVVELLASTAAVVGPERAVAAAHQATLVGGCCGRPVNRDLCGRDRQLARRDSLPTAVRTGLGCQARILVCEPGHPGQGRRGRNQPALLPETWCSNCGRRDCHWSQRHRRTRDPCGHDDRLSHHRQRSEHSRGAGTSVTACAALRRLGSRRDDCTHHGRSPHPTTRRYPRGAPPAVWLDFATSNWSESGWFAGGGTADGLADVWRSIDRRQLFPMRPLLGLRAFSGRSDHAVPATGLRRILRRHMPFDRLEDAEIEFGVIAADARNGHEVVLRTGNAVDAIAVSAALPGVFPPVTIDGQVLIDGGVANNTPISTAIDAGATEVWVLSTGYSCALVSPPKSALAMAMHSAALLIQQRLVLESATREYPVPVHLIPPPCPITVTPIDFSQTESLMARSRAGTQQWLDNGCPFALPLHIGHDHFA